MAKKATKVTKAEPAGNDQEKKKALHRLKRNAARSKSDVSVTRQIFK